MSLLRTPQSLVDRLDLDTGQGGFEAEVMQEQAAALGRLGRRAEAALAALRAHQGEGRAEVLKSASDAVWCFFVQRDVMGLRDRAQIIADYQIPREVIARLGVR